MNKYIIMVLLLTVPGPLIAATSDDLKLDTSVRPKKAFSAEVPDGLAWQVRMLPQQKSATSASELLPKLGEADGTPGEDPTAAARLEVYRALMQQGTVVELRVAYAQGLRQESLRYGGGREVERFQKSGLVAYNDWKTGEVSLDTNGWSASGPLWGIGRFEELSWITSAHYAGATKFEGRPSFVYRQYPGPDVPGRSEPEGDPSRAMPEDQISLVSGIPASKAGADPSAAPNLTAFIDAETMLPLALLMPDETWIYKILDTDTIPRMSAEIAAALQEREKAFEKLRNKYRAAP